MKKYIYAVLILTVFGLQGCNNEDIRICCGKIYYQGDIYQINNARRFTTIINHNHDTISFNTYFHALLFEQTDGNTFATLLVRSESNELQSGEFHLSWVGVTQRDNSIQMNVDLEDDFFWFSRNFGSGTKMKLSITEDRNGIFNIELRQADGKGDFFITYRGLVPETFN